MNKTVILVTGANRGIGFTLCKILSSQKNFFIILSSRNQIEGELRTNSLASNPSEVHYAFLDVSDHQSLPDQVNSIVRTYGSIDVLVNNAGVYLDSSDLDEFPSFLEVTENILKKTFETNLFGPILLTRLLLPHMKENSIIINISSGGGKINTSGDRSGHIAYRTSKTALNAFSYSLGNQYTNRATKVISMCPGWVRSEFQIGLQSKVVFFIIISENNNSNHEY